VPVIVAKKLPALEPEHVKVELPDPPVIEVADRLQTRLVEFVVTPKVTVPVKPFRGATVIVEFAATATFTLTEVGLALTVKSGASAT
jgi:hypothetical protein